MLLTTLMWGAVLLFSVIVSDFDAERSCGWRLKLIDSGYCRLTMCGFIRGLLPGALDAPCWLLNALPFALIAAFVLWRIIQNEARLLRGERSRAR